ncbi:MAG: major capsid protein [Oligoflexales bacterium]
MDIYSTSYMMGVVRAFELDMDNYFLKTFFPSQVSHTTEQIVFDTIENSHRIANFVHPDAKAPVTEDLGYSTKFVKPAYIKELRVHTPDRNIKRSVGEPITGTMSPEQRSKINMNLAIKDAMEMVERRKEKMAFDACLDAKVEIKGKGLDTEVDFGRSDKLEITLGESEGFTDEFWQKWDHKDNDNGSLDADLHTQFSILAEHFFDIAKVSPTHTIMTSATFRQIVLNPRVRELLDFRRGDDSDIYLGARKAHYGIRYAGRLGEFPIFTYRNEYQDETGKTVQFLKDGYVMFLSTQLEGVRHYGMIHDFGAKLQALPYYADSWTEKNPSKRLFQIQCSPLMVPYRPNCSMKVKVL